MYRPIGRYRRLKQKMNDILKTSARYSAATTNLKRNTNSVLTLSLTLLAPPTVGLLAVTPNPNFLRINNAPFATGNQRTANDVLC